jgi:hypothetical protein
MKPAYVDEFEQARAKAHAAPPTPETPAARPSHREAGAEEGRRESMATTLVKLALELGVEPWHDASTRDAFIAVPCGAAVEHFDLRSRDARDWLGRLAHTKLHKAVPSAVIADAINTLASKARFDGQAHPVATRVAALGTDGIVLDLADAACRVVLVTPDGWSVTSSSSVRFRRSRGMLPLPEPTRGGSLDDLRPLLNVQRDDDFRLLVGWLLQALSPTGPYPVLTLIGEQGTAKSTAGRLLRNLVDPNVAALRGDVRKPDDLMIAAKNSHVVALDNISKLPEWLSDALCRIATGGGFGTRQLFTDSDELLIDVQRPTLLTSITSVVSRGDLQDRAITVPLAPIPDEARRPERELLAAYEAIRPRVLGALLDAVAGALRERPGVQLARLPRLADHAIWVTAAEPALGWPSGAYLAAFNRQSAEAVELALDGDIVARVLGAYLDGCGGLWSGTAGDLRDALTPLATNADGWPRNARGLSAALDRLAPQLRDVGVDISRRREGRGGTRLLTIRRTTVSNRQPSGQTVSTNPNENGVTDDADATDGRKPLSLSSPLPPSQKGTTHGTYTV